jgi:hypothetical protein
MMGNPGIQVESHLPAGRQVFIDLNGEMLASGAAQDLGEEGTSLPSLEIDIDPAEAERELRASPLGAVMLGEGRRLLRSRDDSTGGWSELIIGDVEPSAVEVTAFARSWVSTPEFQTSGRAGYTRRGVGVRLWYGERTDDQKGDAAQHLGIGFEFNTYENKVNAAISRLVVASPRLASRGVDLGRSEKTRSANGRNDRKLLLATQTVRRLFELRAVE